MQHFAHCSVFIAVQWVSGGCTVLTLFALFSFLCSVTQCVSEGEKVCTVLCTCSVNTVLSVHSSAMCELVRRWRVVVCSAIITLV